MLRARLVFVETKTNLNIEDVAVGPVKTTRSDVKLANISKT